MKKILLTGGFSIILALSIASCSNMKNRDYGTIAGGAVGAAAGGLLTHSAAGAAVGAVAGGVGGYYIGKSTEKNN